jgi:hypothetical protein
MWVRIARMADCQCPRPTAHRTLCCCGAPAALLALAAHKHGTQ